MRLIVVWVLVVVATGLAVGLGVWASHRSDGARGEWTPVDLGTLGGQQSAAVAINDEGQVVGWAETAEADDEGAVEHAALWANGRIIDLGTLGGSRSEAVALNDHGQVVGWSTTASKDEYGGAVEHAFVWEAGKMRDLGTLSGARSKAAAIDDEGVVVGEAETASGDPHAFRWEAERIRDLGTLGGSSSSAAALSASGEVVGQSETDTGETSATVWKDGEPRELRPLGFAPPDLGLDVSSEAVAINTSGVIAGVSPTDYGEMHAVVWRGDSATDLGAITEAGADLANPNGEGYSVAINEQGQIAFNSTLWEDGVARDLGSLCDRCSTEATAINEQGQVVGWSGERSGDRDAPQSSEFPDRAFVWANQTMTSLEPLPAGNGPSHAYAVNNHSEIVGWATTNTGDQHAVLWTKKP